MSRLVGEERKEIKKIILTLHPDSTTIEIECNPTTAEKLFKGVVYPFPDRTTYYLFPCEECKEIAIEYENGGIERRRRRGCPFLKLEEEIETASSAYQIYFPKFKVVRGIIKRCELYRFRREVKLHS